MGNMGRLGGYGGPMQGGVRGTGDGATPTGKRKGDMGASWRSPAGRRARCRWRATRARPRIRRSCVPPAAVAFPPRGPLLRGQRVGGWGGWVGEGGWGGAAVRASDGGRDRGRGKEEGQEY